MITHKHTSKCIYLCYFPLTAQGERAVLPSMGCRGMSSLKGCGFFKDILVTNRVSILVILVSNWVLVLHSSLELIAMFSVFLEAT